MKRLGICTLILTLGMVGCATDRTYMRAYEGPPLPAAEEALLKPYLGTIVRSINGDRRFAITPMRAGRSNLDGDIALQPGRTKIVLGYELHGMNSYRWSLEDKTVEFDAQAGRKYRLNVRLNEAQTAWIPFIEDVSNNPEKWCWFDEECAKRGPSRPIPPELRK